MASDILSPALAHGGGGLGDGTATSLAGVLSPSPGAMLRRRIFGHAGLMIGATALCVIIAMAAFAPWLAPHDPYDQDLARRLIPPIWHDKGVWAHPLGTDMLGRDYLSRLIYGSQISLLIGFAVMVISGLIGTTLGVLAGYFGGRIDLAISYLITTRLSLPVVLVALAVVALIGGSLWVVVAVPGLLKWDRFAVVMRSATSWCPTRPCASVHIRAPPGDRSWLPCHVRRLHARSEDEQ